MSNLPIIPVFVGIALLGYWGYQYSENNESAGIAGGLALLGGIGLMARGKRS